MNTHLHPPTTRRAFTLVELLLATVLLSLLLIALLGTVDTVRRSTTTARGKTRQYREARIAFDLITSSLSAATLNTYWDYYYTETASNAPPTGSVRPPGAYVRQSELQFQSGKATTLIGGASTPATNPGHAVFFQAPLGLTHYQGAQGSLLNSRGFAIQHTDDSANRPPFLTDYPVPKRFRYRLMEYRPPAEKTTSHLGNTIYTHPADWYRQDIDQSARVLAENIILLVFSPQVSADSAHAASKPAHWIAPRYTYNSLDVNNATPAVDNVTISKAGEVVQGTQHLLPPVVVVTMIALDEVSAARWSERSGDQPVDILDESGATFTDAASYAADLQAVETWLTAQKLHFETFTSAVILRNARWDSRTF